MQQGPGRSEHTTDDPVDDTIMEYSMDSKCRVPVTGLSYCLGHMSTPPHVVTSCEHNVRARSSAVYEPLADEMRTAVVLIAATRLTYFRDVIRSLQQQTSRNFDL